MGQITGVKNLHEISSVILGISLLHREVSSQNIKLLQQPESLKKQLSETDTTDDSKV